MPIPPDVLKKLDHFAAKGWHHDAEVLVVKRPKDDVFHAYAKRLQARGMSEQEILRAALSQMARALQTWNPSPDAAKLDEKQFGIKQPKKSSVTSLGRWALKRLPAKHRDFVDAARGMSTGMVVWYAAFLAAFDRPLFDQNRAALEAIIAPRRENLAVLTRELARLDGRPVEEGPVKPDRATAAKALAIAKAEGARSGKRAVLDGAPSAAAIAELAEDAWFHAGLPALEDAADQRGLDIDYDDPKLRPAFEAALRTAVRARVTARRKAKRPAPRHR